MRDLGGDPFSITAAGINDAGQVVGGAIDLGFQPVLWPASGSMRRLDMTLPGDITLGSGIALGINNRGQVVGGISGMTVGMTNVALWTGGDLQSLGDLSEGAFVSSFATGINNRARWWAKVKGIFPGLTPSCGPPAAACRT